VSDLVSLAIRVLGSNWVPDDDKGRGAQLIAEKLTHGSDFKEALAIYDAAIRVFPRVPPLLMLRSAVHRRLGNFPEADADCAKILELDPDNVRALIGKFWIGHDWAEREIPDEERERRKSEARRCLGAPAEPSPS
jgi:tetratricopeptide (TPR) repeat protein